MKLVTLLSVGFGKQIFFFNTRSQVRHVCGDEFRRTLAFRIIIITGIFIML